MASSDSFGARSSLEVGGASYEIFRLDAVTSQVPGAADLPYSLKVLLENLLRTEDGAARSAAPPPSAPAPQAHPHDPAADQQDPSH